jgi:hypothetical protein
MHRPSGDGQLRRILLATGPGVWPLSQEYAVWDSASRRTETLGLGTSRYALLVASLARLRNPSGRIPSDLTR